MNFDLTDEQAALARSLDDYLTDRYRAAEPASAAHWAAFAALGWLGAALPEQAGGSAGGPVETMLVMEAFGRHAVTEPYLATVALGAGLLQAADDRDGVATWLAGVAAGTCHLAAAIAEPQARYDLHDVATTAAQHEGGWRLAGRKVAVLNAPDADVIIVSARLAGGRRDRHGIGLFTVPRDAPGLRLRRLTTQDGLGAADIELGDVALPAAALLVPPEHGAAALEEVVDAATAALCAMAVGCMAACVDRTADYLRLRRQFGRPLAGFQALQHRMVDMHVAMEESRSLVLAATIALQAGRDVARAVSAAKICVAEAGRRIGEEAVQMHGGIGMTDAFAIGSYYKRLLTCASLFGDVDHHVGRYARAFETIGASE